MSRRRSGCGAAFRAVLLVLLFLGLSQAAWMAVAGDAFAQSAEEIARRRIADFKSTFDPGMVKAAGLTQSQAEQMRKIYAFQLSNDYTARRLLKMPEFADLGKEYYKMWFQEGDGLIRQVIGKAKGKNERLFLRGARAHRGHPERGKPHRDESPHGLRRGHPHPDEGTGP